MKRFLIATLVISLSLLVASLFRLVWVYQTLATGPRQLDVDDLPLATLQITLAVVVVTSAAGLLAVRRSEKRS